MTTDYLLIEEIAQLPAHINGLVGEGTALQIIELIRNSDLKLQLMREHRRIVMARQDEYLSAQEAWFNEDEDYFSSERENEINQLIEEMDR